ncbi:MAG TPA: hypothetical protein VIP77_17155 [Jiangellaceae bacterium]
MRALVVYESMFGNTQAIAEAIGHRLEAVMDVDVKEVGAVEAVVPDDVDLLVAGGPTHVLGLSRPRTRQDAADKGEGAVISAGIGVREWLDDLPDMRREVAAAAFATRADKPRLPGSAARAANRRLKRHGFRVVTPPQDFYVTGLTGPLAAGELDHARTWAAGIAVAVPASDASRGDRT